MDDRLERYLAGGYRRVEGWLEPGALRLIERLDRAQRERGLSGPVGEIGVHHGQLFIALYLLARADERAVAVDIFEQQELNPDGSGLGDEARLRDNLRRHAGGVERLALIKGDSSRLGGEDLVRAAGGRLRWLSVDGGHTAELTRHDLETAEAALAEGGIIVLDDYFHELFPGVSEGTNDFFRAGPRRVVPFAIGANKLLLTTDRAADAYRRALCEPPLGSARQERQLFGAPVLRIDFRPLPWKQALRASPAWQTMRDTPAGRAVRAVLRWASRARAGGRAGVLK